MFSGSPVRVARSSKKGECWELPLSLHTHAHKNTPTPARAFPRTGEERDRLEGLARLPFLQQQSRTTQALHTDDARKGLAVLRSPTSEVSRFPAPTKAGSPQVQCVDVSVVTCRTSHLVSRTRTERPRLNRCRL